MSDTSDAGRATREWLLDAYRETLRASDRSSATQRAYGSDLELFVAWAIARDLTAPAEVTTKVLRDYLD